MVSETQVKALAHSITGCFSNVTDLPDWMQVPALGRDTYPLLLIAARAALNSDYLAAMLTDAHEAGKREGAAEVRARVEAAIDGMGAIWGGAAHWLTTGDHIEALMKDVVVEALAPNGDET